jgi:hypothetical protein
MLNRPADLPDYKKPPVIEVGLAVQFEPIDQLSTAQIGLLWQAFKDRYPRTEDHAPQQPTVERFGAGLPRAKFHIQLIEAVPPHCTWMMDREGTTLIQVQRDRFAVNWRGEGEHYCRYENVREAFFRELEVFADFLKRNDIQLPDAAQCEVTYINGILPCGVWGEYGEADRVVSVLTPREKGGFLPVPEQVRLMLSYVMRGADEPIGRLHVSLEPGSRERNPALTMTLTARGRSLGPGTAGMQGFFDVGRDWIVRGFSDLTRPEMHEAWGRVR